MTPTTQIHLRLVLVVNLHVEGIPLLHVRDVLLVPDLESVLSGVDVERSSPTPSLAGDVYTAPPAGG